MLIYESLNVAHDVGTQATVVRQQDRLKPELAFALPRRNMNVRRLTPFVGVEVEAKTPDSQDRWHGGLK